MDLLVVNLYTPMHTIYLYTLRWSCNVLLSVSSSVMNRTMVVVAETNLQAALSAFLLDLQAVRYKDLSTVTSKWSLASSIVCVKLMIN